MFNKSVTAFLIILVAILTVSTSYFYTQTKNKPSESQQPSNLPKNSIDQLDPKVEGVDTKKQTSMEQPVQTNKDSEQKQSTSAPTADGEQSPLVNQNRASNPEKAHLVKAGETLYPIGLKYNLDWNIIARANGMDNPNDIKAGNVIIIPDFDKDTNKISINYKIDPDKAATLEKNTALGREVWRLDPLEVSKRESTPCFKITSADTFSLGSKNEEKGLAQVSVVKGDKSYEVGLVQPGEKGASGIWTITYIKEI